MEIKEEWKLIIGFPNYKISSFGNVYSLTHEIVKRPFYDHRGYRKIFLSLEGKNKQFFISTLVALAFIGQRLPGKQINHINGNKTDDSVGNLEYCTGSENMKHAFRTGLHNMKGSRHPRAKFTEKHVMAIREFAKNVDSVDRKVIDHGLSKIFNVSPCTIFNVRTGRSWKHVKSLLNDTKVEGKA